MGETAIKYLTETLRREDASVKEIELLCKIGGKLVVPNLVEYLRNIDMPLITDTSGATVTDNENPMQLTTAEALAQLGDKRGAEVVVDFLMNHPKSLKFHKDEYIKKYSSLFGDFTDLIVQLVLYDYQSESKNFTLQENVNALMKLCEIDNPIVNNLLHKIRDKINFTERVGHGDWGGEYKIISTNKLRDMAKEELTKRGSPPYEPIAYLREENWKLV